MKNYTILFVCLLSTIFTPLSIIAQGDFQLGDTTKYVVTAESMAAENEMRLGKTNPMIVPLGYAELKQVEKAWRKFVSDYKGKATGATERTGDGEWFTKNAIVPQIGGNCYFDIYAKFTQTGDSVTLGITFDVGKVQFTHEEYQSKYAGALSFTRLFALRVRAIFLQKHGDEQQAVFLKAIKERKSVGKDIAYAMKTVEELKYKIEKMQMQVESEITDISTMKKRYAELDELIEKRREVLNEINLLIRQNQ